MFEESWMKPPQAERSFWGRLLMNEKFYLLLSLGFWFLIGFWGFQQTTETLPLESHAQHIETIEKQID